MTHRTRWLAALVLLVSPIGADADLFYTHHLDLTGGGPSLGVMETSSASGRVIGSYGLPAPVVDPSDPSADIYNYAISGAFGRDGALYTIVQTLGDRPEESSSRLAVVDLATGLATPFGATIEFNLLGMEIDDQDTIWATGFSEFPLASTPTVGLFGDTNLYRVDSKTGETTLVGDTGVERLMDLAFDSKGILWGTVDNKMYTIDTNTGQATWTFDLAGVTEAIPPEDLLPFQQYVEIMGIAFDADDKLYGNTFTVNAGLFTIDTGNGAASLVGRSGLTLAHGGDILPNPADVLSDLREDLDSMDLPVGISTALSTKLDRAYELVLSGAAHPDPVHHLETFVNFVENHNGTKIAADDAYLLADAAMDAASLLQLDLGSHSGIATVPEPAGGVLMLLGFLGLAAKHQRRRLGSIAN